MLSHPEFPQGALFGGAVVSDGFMGKHPVSILASLRAHGQGGCNVMA